MPTYYLFTVDHVQIKGQYIDGSGEKRFVGTKALKLTQILGLKPCLFHAFVLGPIIAPGSEPQHVPHKQYCLHADFPNTPPYWPQLRVYPPGFGKRLVEMYEAGTKMEPRADLRRKFAVSPDLTDREAFDQYPTGDLWPDAKLTEALLYLARYKGLKIPDSWNHSIQSFIGQLST